MPQVAAAWTTVQAIWTGLGAWAAAIKLAAVVAVSYGSSKYQAKKMKDDSRFQGRDVNVRSATEPEMVVYGQAWVAGPVLYLNQRHTPASKDNFESYVGIIHAAHECEDIIDLRFDNDLVTDASDIDWGAGIVSAGKYGISRGGVYAVQVEKHLGTSSQTVSTMLNAAFTDFTSAHRCRGRAYTVCRFNFFSSTTLKPENLFSSGPPQNIRALVKGKKVYDPRLDSTVSGGSGSHRFATPSTWAWSDNPVLCAADYLTQYCGIAGAKMDWVWIIAEANKCDTLVAIPGSLTQKRYTCNGVVSLGNKRGVSLDAILSSCMGTRSKVNAKWRITVGGYATPDVTLTDADIVGDVTYIGSLSKNDRSNKIEGTYVSATDFATELEFLPMTSSAYVTRDNGEVLPKNIQLPMSNHEYQAQRIAYKHLLQGNNMKVIDVPLRWTGLLLHEGCGVSLSYTKLGFVGKSFRCIDLKIGNDNAPIIATLREDSSGAWADPAAGTYSTRSAQGVVTLGTVDVPAEAGQLPYIEDFEDNSIIRVQSEWYPSITSGEESIVNETGTPPLVGGSLVWQFGNSSGSDEVQRFILPGRSFAIDLNVLYRITWHYRRAAGSGIAYLGVQALGADRVTVANCTTTGSIAHWFAASNYTPPGTGWVTKVGYFKNDGVSTGDDLVGVTTSSAPGLLNNLARYISPFFLVNYSAVAGISQIGYVSIERIGGVGDSVLNSEVVVPSGGTWEWTADSAGAYPAGNPTQALVATFWRNGVSIATHTVTATLTTSTGSISVADTSSTGETTTYSENGDPSQFVTATITHPSSNQAAALTFYSTNQAYSGYGGGGGGGSGGGSGKLEDAFHQQITDPFYAGAL